MCQKCLCEWAAFTLALSDSIGYTLLRRSAQLWVNWKPNYRNIQHVQKKHTEGIREHIFLKDVYSFKTSWFVYFLYFVYYCPEGKYVIKGHNLIYMSMMFYNISFTTNHSCSSRWHILSTCHKFGRFFGRRNYVKRWK